MAQVALSDAQGGLTAGTAGDVGGLVERAHLRHGLSVLRGRGPFGYAPAGGGLADALAAWRVGSAAPMPREDEGPGPSTTEPAPIEALLAPRSGPVTLDKPIYTCLLYTSPSPRD